MPTWKENVDLGTWISISLSPTGERFTVCACVVPATARCRKEHKTPLSPACSLQYRSVIAGCEESLALVLIFSLMDEVDYNSQQFMPPVCVDSHLEKQHLSSVSMGMVESLHFITQLNHLCALSCAVSSVGSGTMFLCWLCHPSCQDTAWLIWKRWKTDSGGKQERGKNRENKPTRGSWNITMKVYKS